jgi:hypothetical protein
LRGAPATHYQLADFNEICVGAAERIEEFGAGAYCQRLSHLQLRDARDLGTAISRSVADHSATEFK